jgi:uncharacterized protein YbaP (TraB family)
LDASSASSFKGTVLTAMVPSGSAFCRATPGAADPSVTSSVSSGYGPGIDANYGITIKDRMPTNRCPVLALLIALIATFLLASPAANAGTCCVWRITNVPHPFYLVGTVHALSGTDYPLPKPYEMALRDSQRLVFEMKPDPKSDFPDKFGLAATYPKGDEIGHHVHPQTWQFLAKQYGYSHLFEYPWTIGHHQMAGIQELRPWAVAFMLWGVRGYNDVFSKHGVDNHIAYQGRRMGKELAGLETTEEHVAVLAGMSDIESELILLDALVRGDKRRDDFNQLRAAWKKGDVAAMWELDQRERKQNPGAQARLLDMRNVKWVPRIKEEINSGKPTAIVVGAGHYPGYNGLLKLLEHQGFTIEQL